MAICGNEYTTDGGRQFVCSIAPHPEKVGEHYYRRTGTDNVIDNVHLESNLEDFFRKAVRAAGGRATKITSMDKGLPDRLVMMPGGRMYLVELKAVGGSLSPIQVVWHERAAEIGTIVATLTGREQVTAWIASL